MVNGISTGFLELIFNFKIWESGFRVFWKERLSLINLFLHVPLISLARWSENNPPTQQSSNFSKPLPSLQRCCHHDFDNCPNEIRNSRARNPLEEEKEPREGPGAASQRAPQASWGTFFPLHEFRHCDLTLFQANKEKRTVIFKRAEQYVKEVSVFNRPSWNPTDVL